MLAPERRAFLRQFGLGLGLIVVAYVLTTILRSVRADFAPEIWESLGVTDRPEIFTQSEIWVALGVLVVNGASSLILSNRRAFFASLAISAAGFGLVLLGIGLHAQHRIGGFELMVLLGLGLYLPYVAVHTTVFERLIAMTRQRGNLGFLIYVADTAGYAGYVVVMLVRAWLLAPGRGLSTAEATVLDGVSDSSFADGFVTLCLLVAVLSLTCLGLCAAYFQQRVPRDLSDPVA